MFGYGGSHMFWGGGLLMLLFWFAVVMLVIWGIGLLFSQQKAERHPAPFHSENAETIVERRYARGEISREEYLAILKDLQTINGGKS
jgi:uncharacterized membrane protein